MSHEKIIQTAWTTIGQREYTMWAKNGKLPFTAPTFVQIVTAIRNKQVLTWLKTQQEYNKDILDTRSVFTSECGLECPNITSMRKRGECFKIVTLSGN